MDNRKNEFVANVGMAIFIAFAMLMLSSFSGNPINQIREPVKIEEAVGHFSTHAKSIIVDVARVPAYSQQWISCIDRLYLNTFSENLKIRDDNERVLHQKNVLQNLAYSLKPILIFHHVYCLMSEKSDNAPILS